MMTDSPDLDVMREQRRLVLQVLDSMSEHGQWCGESALQHSTYLVQSGVDAPHPFSFGRYKYGPVSFEMQDMLGEMRADMLLDIVRWPGLIGPTLKPSRSGIRMLRAWDDPLQVCIDDVIARYATQGHRALSLRATALLVATSKVGASLAAQADAILAIRPPASYSDAEDALRCVAPLLHPEGTPPSDKGVQTA